MLGIYSGRPDPHWDLLTHQLETLEELALHLPQIEVTWALPVWGYTGFVLLNSKEPRSWDQLDVYREQVSIRKGDVVTHHVDPHCLVERFLLDSARSYVSEGVLTSLWPREPVL